MLKYIVLSFVLLFFTSTVYAVNTKGLSDTQKATLELEAAKLREKQGAMPVTPQAAKEWAELGQAVGKGLVATAKELGMSADEVMTTTTGKIAAGLIIWKVAGEDLVGIVFGIVWLFLTLSIWTWLYRTHGSRKIDGFRSMEVSSKLWSLVGKDNKVTKKVPEYRDTSEEIKVFYFIALILLTGVGLLSIFA